MKNADLAKQLGTTQVEIQKQKQKNNFRSEGIISRKIQYNAQTRDPKERKQFNSNGKRAHKF